MSLNKKLIIASILIAVIFVQQGQAIKCFECNSRNNEHCDEDVVPKDYLTDCSVKGSTFTFCRKIKQIIEFSVNGLPPDTRIIRSCGSDNSTHYNSCYQRAGFGGRQEVCACDKEECNSANSHVVSHLTIGIAAAIVIFTRFF